MRLNLRAYLYDVRQSLFGRVLPLVVVLALLGTGLAVDSASSEVSSIELNASGAYYYEGGAYHLYLWVYDVAGAPVSGVSIGIQTGNYSGSPGNGPVFMSRTSDNEGEVQYALPIPDLGASIQVEVSDPSSPHSSLSLDGVLQGMTLDQVPPGEVQGLDPLTAVAAGFYSSLAQLVVYWIGMNGSQPTGASLVYCTALVRAGSMAPSNCSSLTTQLIGQISSVRSTFTPPTGPPGSTVIVELIDSAGRTASIYTYGGASSSAGGVAPQAVPILPPTPGVTSLSQFLSNEVLVLSLGAFTAALLAYAQPRLSGTIEPVLVRPVTRRGIYVDRYIVGTIAYAASALTGLAAFAASASLMSREPLPTAYVAPIFVSLVVPACAFGGLVMLVSHLARTSGAMLAVAGGLVLALGVFWDQISSRLSSLFLSGGSSAALTATQIRIGALSPVQTPLLTLGFLTGSGESGGPGSLFALAQITPLSVGVIACLWLVLPFIAGFLLCGYRD